MNSGKKGFLCYLARKARIEIGVCHERVGDTQEAGESGDYIRRTFRVTCDFGCRMGKPLPMRFTITTYAASGVSSTVPEL